MLARRTALLVLVGSLLSCVNVDPETGETIPRGSQRYEFSRVKEAAEGLHKGMTKLEVLFLLGSPAEKAARGDRWVYLPERPGVLIPATALQLEFQWDELVEWGYHPIVLGQKL